MPGWLVAILVALVGLFAGVLGTYFRIVHERSAEIRTRMLDAADAFVTGMTTATDAFGTAQLKVGLWAHISRMAGADEHLAQREHEAQAAHNQASDAWSVASERVPRIGLLFGVDDPAARLADRASEELGEAVVALAKLRGEVYDTELDEAAIQARNHATFEVTNRRLESTRYLIADFSRAARLAIVGRRPWQRLTRKRDVVQVPCEEEAATNGESRPDGSTESG